MFYKLRTLFILLIFLSLSNISSAQLINKIDIEGNIRLDDNTIFSYLNIKKIQKYI